MNRLPVYLLAGLILVTQAASASEKEPEPGPTYAGKTLGEWLSQLGSENADERGEAADAVRKAVRASREGLHQVAGLLRHPNQDVRVQALKLLPAYGEQALPVLSATLWDPEPAMRLGAMMALRELKSTARGAVLALAARSADPEPVNRAYAAELLGDLELRSAVPALRVLLQDEHPLIRGLAINSLVKLHAVDRETVAALVSLLQHDNPDLRSPAARILGSLGRSVRAEVPHLVKATRDPSAEVRKAAVRSLGKIGVASDEVLEALDRVFKDEVDVDLLLTAAESHWRLRKDPAVVERIQPILDGDDVNLYVVDAARLLWRINRSPRAVAVLGKVLAEGNEEERHKALLVLGLIGPAAKDSVKEVTALLDLPSTGVRAEASWVLGRIGDAAAPSLPKLESLFEDANPWVRLHSLHASWQIKSHRRYVVGVVKHVADEDKDVREGAAALLKVMGRDAKEEAEAALVKALADEEPRVRLASALALWAISKHPRALKTVVELLDHQDPEVRRNAASTFGVEFKDHGKEAVGALVRALWDVDNYVQANAAEAIGRIGPDAKEAIPALATVLGLDDVPDNVHSATAEALGLLGPDAKVAVPALLKRLKHPSSYVRALAAKSLWILEEHPDAVPVLEADLDDYRPEARIAAAEGLWRARKDPRAITVLVEVLREHIDLSVPPTHENLEALANHRYMAARALGRIGPPARDALPALRDLLHDEDSDLRDTIADAVRKIEAEKK